MRGLDSSEKKLLRKSLLGIDENFRQALYEIIIKLTESNSWVSRSFSEVISRRLKFQNREIDNPAQYNPEARIIILDTNLLKVMGRSNLFSSVLKSIFLHELTHSIDFSEHKYNIIRPMTIERLSIPLIFYSEVADAIFNVIHCFRRGHPIDANALSKLLTLLPEENQINWRAVPSRLSNLLSAAAMKTTIEKFGSIENFDGDSNVTFFLTGLEIAGHNNSVFIETANPVRALKLYRKAPGFNAKIKDSTTLRLRKAWLMLPEDLQNIIDVLHIFQNRMLTNTIKDKKCYPLLLQCVKELSEDCVSEYISCLKSTNPVTSLRALSEIHASLRERLFLENINLLSLSESCRTPGTEPETQNKNVFTQRETENSKYSIINGSGASFVLGFSDTLGKNLLDQTRCSSLMKLFIMFWINMLLYKILGMDVLSSGVFKLFLLATDSVLQRFNWDKVNIRGYELNVSHSIFFGVQCSASRNIAPMAVSIASGSLGSNAANLLTHFIFQKPQVQRSSQPQTKTFGGLKKGFLIN